MSARARLLSFLVFAGPAAADSSAGLTLEDAASRALEADARIRAESSGVTAAQAQADLDSLAPPLTLGGEFENAAGTGKLTGISSAEATVRVSRIFERGGKREARRQLGSAVVERQRHRVEARRLEVLADVASRYIEVLSAEAELAVAVKQVESATAVKDAVAYRVSRGVAAESDAKLAEIAVARAALARRHAQHALLAARTSLATLFGLESPDFGEVEGTLSPLPSLPELDALAAKLPATAPQRALALEARELDARRALAKTIATPDITVSLGVRRLEALDDQGLVASVSVPLGTRQRSSLALARARAERDALDARIEAEHLDAYRSLFQQYQELEHASTEYEVVVRDMLPAAAEAVRLTQRGYDEARYSFLQLMQARAVLVDLERQRIDAAARYHRQLAVIERATAQPEGHLP